MKNQISRLAQYLDNLPLTVIAPENIEADDSMAYLSQQVYPESQFYIMSTDKDFLQLVDDRVQIWSPTKKKLYFKDDILEDFGVPNHNFLTYRLMKGDSSDNIPGVKGTGVKTLMKSLPILFGDKKITVDDIIEYTTKNNKSKINQRLSESRDILELNYDLMQLDEVDIHGIAKGEVMEIARDKIPLLVKFKFLTMMLEDSTNASIKNPELWLKQVFAHLNAMAMKREEDDR
jgi:DNA polymerase-1